MSKPAVKVASLAFEIAAGATVPNEAHLLPVGPFRSDDGRPEDSEAWQLDAAIAANVIQRLRDRKNDTLIDYEHQSLRSEYNGQPVIAAGWFHDMHWREGKGLYATGVDWTAAAKQRITDKEYRFISAVFYYYSATGEILDVISVALTNTPAIDGLDGLGDDDGLATLSKRFSLPDLNPETTDMPTPQEELAALRVTHVQTETALATLTAERDTLKNQLAALVSESDTLKTQVAALTQAQADAVQAADQQKHADLLAAALTDGRLAPAQKPWAEKQSLAALTEYLEATGPLPLVNKQAGGDHKPAHAALTKEERDVMARTGVSEDEFLQQKAANAGATV
ncbi:MAG: phage protease [Methylicorpusculum sp.]|uniref:phage protease n=1 Tax=Methylicorpusculum sp. TaxID=2713644 RepID=UPI00272F40AB|nr:phage protease [Methylicorpusculum sp.]MDP2202276.1 phage protease [Methylicorpusculum sp.]